MSITVLSDVIAPNSIWAAAVRGKQRRLNARGENRGGHKKINVVRARTVRQYEFGTVPMQQESPEEFERRILTAWQALEGLHEVTEGGAYGFLVDDPKDATATHANGVVTLVAGETNVYQLWKQYTSVGSARKKSRKITRPKSAGFSLKISGSTASEFTLDVETGRITIPSSPSAADVTWAGRFHVPVHFEEDDLDWDLLVAGALGTRYVAAPNVVLTEILE